VIGDILQPTHLLFVLVIALLVLGPKRLPEVGRSLGRGIRDFKSAISGEDQDRPEEIVATTPAEPVSATPVVPAAVTAAEPVAAVPAEPAPSVHEPVDAAS
jgi:sec-independent protein translocase protein TatA